MSLIKLNVINFSATTISFPMLLAIA